MADQPKSVKGKQWAPHEGPQTRFLASAVDEALYGGAAGGGKMLALDTPLPTPGGWIALADVRCGDLLFGDGGSTTRVLQVHAVKTPPECYRLTFDDGATIDACGDHRWKTLTAPELEALTKRTDVYRRRRRAKRPSRATGRRSAAFIAAITARNQKQTPPAKPAPAGTVRTTRELAETLLTKRGRRNQIGFSFSRLLVNR